MEDGWRERGWGLWDQWGGCYDPEDSTCLSYDKAEREWATAVPRRRMGPVSQAEQWAGEDGAVCLHLCRKVAAVCDLGFRQTWGHVSSFWIRS